MFSCCFLAVKLTTSRSAGVNLSRDLRFNSSRDVKCKTVKYVLCDIRWKCVIKSYRSVAALVRQMWLNEQTLSRSHPSCYRQTVPNASNFEYFALSHVYLRTH